MMAYRRLVEADKILRMFQEETCPHHSEAYGALYAYCGTYSPLEAK